MKYRKTDGNRIFSQIRKLFNIKKETSAEKNKIEVFVSFENREAYNIFIKNRKPFLNLAATIAGRNSHWFLL